MSNLHKVFTNTTNGKEFIQAKPTHKNRHYNGKTMITETDENGIITYANRYFLEFNGFEKKELIGLPHSIVRHPDTPVGVYKAMWKIIASKKVWRGYLKSLCRDGSDYWALVYIQPRLDANGNIIGYVANRRDASPEAIMEISEKYRALNSEEYNDDEYFMRAELYHGKDLATHA